MVKLRHLVNPLILGRADCVGFFGDSEYTGSDGELVMGYWQFTEYGVGIDDCFSLDDFLDVDGLLEFDVRVCVRNDDGVPCLVHFFYD